MGYSECVPRFAAKHLLFIIVLASATGAPDAARAANVVWDQATCAAGYFDDQSCWVGGALPPSEADTAVFSSAAPVNVSWDPVVLGNWQSLTGSVLPQVTNQGLQVSNGTVDFTSQDAGSYTYKILNDVSVSDSGHLRFNSNMTLDVGGDVNLDSGGTYTATGAGSRLLSAGNLTVGDFETGTLNILNGGSVSNTVGWIGANAGSTGTVTVDGVGSTWSNSAFAVGLSGDGTLNILNGGRVEGGGGAVIGFLSGSTGTVTVEGANSTWANSGSLRVGDEGDGTLNIQNGGSVSNTSAIISQDFNSAGGRTGTVTVDGAGSTWTNTADLTVAYGGDGTLNIQNGGSVSNTWAIIADRESSTGTVTVEGAGSTWINSSYLYVGNIGDGTLNILNGGSVSNSAGVIGRITGLSSAATVDGAGSTWTNTADLTVGEGGTGTLNIQNGGSVSSFYGFIGSAVGSTGTVTVDGAGSTWTTIGNLLVGDEGDGTLNIQNGGSVSNLFGVIGSSVGSTGTVTVDGAGSTWANSNGISVNATGTLNVNAGAVVTVVPTSTVWNGGTVNLSGGRFEAGTVDSSVGIFAMTGGTLHADAFIGDLVNQGGTVGPGHSPGTLTVTGNYSQDANSTLLMEINGLLAGSEYDVLDVSGTATLDGALRILLDPAFDVQLGDTFDLLIAGSVTGAFSDVLGRRISDELRFDVIYGSNSVQLVAAQVPIPGAVWLLGSALAGLGWRRRKQTA